MAYRILVAEDDGDIVQVLKLYLNNEGYEVLHAPNGVEALEIMEQQPADLCIFDIMMPRMDGYELIRRVREFSAVPIIVLSAKREDADRIVGLNIGADDYLVKPFNPLEVVARVRSVLRRCYEFNKKPDPVPQTGEEDGAYPFQAEEDIRFEKLRLDRSTRKLYVDEEIVPTTPAEFRILELLMSHPGRVYTKIQIYEFLNGEYYINDENTITVHISNLRKKIEANNREPRYIQTVRGIGYKFCEEQQVSDEETEK